MRITKIGIFGGTFDPVHNGHLKTAEFLIEKRKYKKIIFIPNFLSPHKTNSRITSPFHRLNMLNLALSNKPEFEVSDFELKRNCISYTFETIQHFSEIYKDLELIIGYDNFLNFNSWKNTNLILNKTKVVILRRNNNKLINIKNNPNFIFVNSPLIDISSTEIRNKIKTDQSIKNLLPTTVINYINKHNLYRDDND